MAHTWHHDNDIASKERHHQGHQRSGTIAAFYQKHALHKQTVPWSVHTVVDWTPNCIACMQPAMLSAEKWKAQAKYQELKIINSKPHSKEQHPLTMVEHEKL